MAPFAKYWTVRQVSKHGVLGWFVLCSTAGVMIGSALFADPPAARTRDVGGRLFPVGMTVADGQPAMATTSFGVRADGLATGLVKEGCIVVPSAWDRRGGDVRLAARTNGSDGAASRLHVTVEQGTGSLGDCTDFHRSAEIHSGTLADLERRDVNGAGIELADPEADRMTVRVRIEPAADHVITAPGVVAWLDVQHRMPAGS